MEAIDHRANHAFTTNVLRKYKQGKKTALTFFPLFKCVVLLGKKEFKILKLNVFSRDKVDILHELPATFFSVYSFKYVSTLSSLFLSFSKTVTEDAINFGEHFNLH